MHSSDGRLAMATLLRNQIVVHKDHEKLLSNVGSPNAPLHF
jgi:hypothetical protein